MNIDEIKTLLKSGDVAGADSAAQELLTAEPDNVQAMMLYGTCRQLQGDEATFRRIHDELESRMARVSDGETQGLWRKYHKLWIVLIASGVVLTGVACYFGEKAKNELNAALYASPVYFELKTERDAIHNLPEGPLRQQRIREYESKHGAGSFALPIGVERVNELNEGRK